MQDTPRSKSPTEPQSSWLKTDALEEPCPGQEDNTRRTVAVEVEPKPVEEDGAVAGQSAAKKRKTTVVSVSKIQMNEPFDSRSLHTFNNCVFSTAKAGF